jgi:hypothetical protein
LTAHVLSVFSLQRIWTNLIKKQQPIWLYHLVSGCKTKSIGIVLLKRFSFLGHAHFIVKPHCNSSFDHSFKALQNIIRKFAYVRQSARLLMN